MLIALAGSEALLSGVFSRGLRLGMVMDVIDPECFSG
jgi:hypothetical protein